MSLTHNETWTALHGMLFGAVFLMAFSGGLAGLYGLRPEWVTAAGLKERMIWIKLGLWTMALVAWLTVITGTFIVYPWYRAKPPAGTADLTAYPRSLLLANPTHADWHSFGMEWKEHIGWLAPIAATVVAFAVTYYGPVLASKPRERRILLLFYLAAFGTAAVAGLLGAFINKFAPVH